MAATAELKELVDQMPDPDSHGMLTEGIDKEKIETAIAAIQKGGRENVLGLIDMLGSPGSEENVKPHYALHCLANHNLVEGDDGARREFCEVLATELDADRPDHIKVFLCQELGWAGRSESVAALGKVLTHDALSAPAAAALAAIGEGAGGQFRAAWPKAEGKARLHVLDGLAAFPDPEAAPLFQEALQDEDREIRIAAAAGLANLGDAGAADSLLKAAASAEGWERFQAAKSCLVLAEKRAAAGEKAEAKAIYENLRDAADAERDRHIRHAAERGLFAASDQTGAAPPEKAPL